MEIEAKARMRDRDAILKALEERGCILGDERVQDDTVYVSRMGDLATFLSNDVFLRVRVQDDGMVLLTAKRPVSKAPEELVKHEHEVVVDSAEEARGILGLLGLQPAVRIVKRRREGECAGFHVCIDDVEGLGAFIELERIAGQTEAAQIQAEMAVFLRELGITPEDRVMKGYDILMIEAQR